MRKQIEIKQSRKEDIIIAECTRDGANRCRNQIVTDVASGEINSILTPGGGMNMKGNKMKIAGNHPDIGIRLIKQDTQEEIQIPANSVLVNEPSKISFILPQDLRRGDYKLSHTSRGRNKLKTIYMIFLKYLEQYADLNRGAMETRDHSNGVSPKNLRSRVNILMSVKGADNKLFKLKHISKIILFVSLIFTIPNIVFISCQKQDLLKETEQSISLTDQQQKELFYGDEKYYELKTCMVCYEGYWTNGYICQNSTYKPMFMCSGSTGGCVPLTGVAGGPRDTPCDTKMEIPIKAIDQYFDKDEEARNQFDKIVSSGGFQFYKEFIREYYHVLEYFHKATILIDAPSVLYEKAPTKEEYDKLNSN
jgi:hypothetical protein